MSKDPIAVFLDIETTGLDYNEDFILEVGMVLVETHTLSPIGYFHSFVAEPGWQERLKHNEYVWNMHQKSGLFKDMPPSTASSTYDNVQNLMLHQLREWERQTGFTLHRTPLWGSSVHFDRNMLNAKMPDVGQYFSHRVVDSSAILERLEITNPELCWGEGGMYQDPLYKQLDKSHRVIADCLDSLRIEKVLQAHVYSRVPGPRPL